MPVVAPTCNVTKHGQDQSGRRSEQLSLVKNMELLQDAY